MKITKNENLLAVALAPNNDQPIKILMLIISFKMKYYRYSTN